MLQDRHNSEVVMRYVFSLACTLLFPVLAAAQTGQMPMHQMQQGQMSPMPHHGNHGQHGQMPMTQQGTSAVPKETGQSAFAAIQEIVVILRADPKTDWSKVNVEALRQHLIDMNNVTLLANVRTEATPEAVKFVVTGSGEVQGSIQRMVLAHADTMNGANGWKLTGEKIANGAVLTVAAPESELKKVKALGFIGTMTEGMHHQEHHLAIAEGVDPHHKH